MKVDAVVLAGGDGAVLDPDIRFKGLLPVAGKPMVEWVVDALRASGTIAGIAVVVPTAEDLGPWVDKVDKLVVSNGPFFENIEAGTSAFREKRPVLITTGDLPALDPRDVEEFLGKSLAAKADFAYPLIPKEVLLEQFPGSKRTYIRLVQGEFTGGNMMMANPSLVERNREIGQRLFDTRKSPVRMARAIGARFVLKLLLGRLDVPDVEAKMGELLGGKGVAIYMDGASIGADVDKPVDVIVAEKVMYAKAGRKARI